MMSESTFLFLDQTAWTAIAAIGSILVVLVALLPIFLDKPILKVTIKAKDTIGGTGRHNFELSILNSGRRKINVDTVIIKYKDIEPNITKIDDDKSEIIEGKRILISDDSWPFTAISIPISIYVQDSKGKRWYVKRSNFKLFMKELICLNDEKPKTIKEEEMARKEEKRKELESKNSKWRVF